MVPVRTINAAPSPRYSGYKRGITWLNAVNDQVAGIGQMVVAGTPRDSLFILDTLLNLDAGPRPEMVTTDNASYSDIVFGLFAILDYRFSPRFADLPDQRYWRAPLPDPLPAGVALSPEQAAITGYGPLEAIARNTINLTKIATQWPDMLRVAGSLVTNQVRAYDLLRMFGRDGHPTPLGQAFAEYGRIAKTLHLLALVDPVDDSYQRTVHRQLTIQESRTGWPARSATPTAGRSIRPTGKGKRRPAGRARPGPQRGGVVEHPLPRRRHRGPARQRAPRAGRDVARLSPLGHAHLNCLGRYAFTGQPPTGCGHCVTRQRRMTPTATGNGGWSWTTR